MTSAVGKLFRDQTSTLEHSGNQMRTMEHLSSTLEHSGNQMRTMEHFSILQCTKDVA